MRGVRGVRTVRCAVHPTPWAVVGAP